jgi:hypothetical protein
MKLPRARNSVKKKPKHAARPVEPVPPNLLAQSVQSLPNLPSELLLASISHLALALDQAGESVWPPRRALVRPRLNPVMKLLQPARVATFLPINVKVLEPLVTEKLHLLTVAHLTGTFLAIFARAVLPQPAGLLLVRNPKNPSPALAAEGYLAGSAGSSSYEKSSVLGFLKFYNVFPFTFPCT